MKWGRLYVVLPLLALLFALPVQAQPKAALEVIPDDAIGYVLLNNPEQLNDKIQALAKKVNSPLPLSPLGFAKTLLGVEKGLDEKGTLAIILLDDDDEPIPVLCIPVTNFSDVMAGLGIKDLKDINEAEVVGKSLVIAKKGNYALATESKNKTALQSVVNAKKSAAAGAATIESYLAENDIVAVIPHTGVKKMSAEAKKGLGDLKDQAAAAPFGNEYVEWLNGLIKSAETEVPNIALGLKIDGKHNILTGMRVDFKKGGQFARTGGSMKPVAGGPLHGLPDEPAAMVFGGIYPEALVKSMLDINAELLKSLGQLEKADIEKMQEAYTLTAKGLRGMAFSIGVGKQGQSFMQMMNAVMKVEDAEGYINGYIKAMETTAEIYKKADNLPFPAMKVKSLKIEDAPAAQVEMDLTKNQQIGENEKQIIEKVLGEGGKMNVTIIAADKNTLLMRYTGTKDAAKALEVYRKNSTGLANNAEIAKTATLLPQGAQWVMYLGPKELIEVGRRLVDDFAPGTVQLPTFPATPPIGLGAEISAEGFDLRIAIPSAVLEGLGKFVKDVQGS